MENKTNRRVLYISSALSMSEENKTAHRNFQIRRRKRAEEEEEKEEEEQTGRDNICCDCSIILPLFVDNLKKKIFSVYIFFSFSTFNVVVIIFFVCLFIFFCFVRDY